MVGEAMHASYGWLMVAGGLLVIQAVGVGVVWHVARHLRAQDRRLENLAEALTLLTEATESGFRSLATEMDRLAQSTPATPRRAAKVTKLAAATRRGQSMADIAAREGVSEGEVALRLHLARGTSAGEAESARTRTTRGAPDRGAVCAG